jgi:hypothetical protein
MRKSFLALLVILGSVQYPHAMPAGMSADCQAEYQKYAAGVGEKAFAKGNTKGCGWSFSRNGTLNMNQIKQRAIGFCAGSAGDNCRIVHSTK